MTLSKNPSPSLSLLRASPLSGVGVDWRQVWGVGVREEGGDVDWLFWVSELGDEGDDDEKVEEEVRDGGSLSEEPMMDLNFFISLLSKLYAFGVGILGIITILKSSMSSVPGG